MPQHEHPKVEQDHHRKAFEIYYSLGEKRTYRAVADQLSVSVSSIKAWSRAHGRTQRIRERDAQQARDIADRVRQDGAVENERHLKIVRAALIRLARGIADGKIRMQLSDVDRMIRLERQLSGADREAPPTTHGPGPVYILPDDGSGPAFRAPTFVLRDNGSAIRFEHSEQEAHDDQD